MNEKTNSELLNKVYKLNIDSSNKNKYEIIINNNINLKDYLVKCSTVNVKFIENFHHVFKEDYFEKYNEFINDFFSFYNTEEKNNFSINIEAIAKWFNMTKGHIKDTLTESYIKNIDYKIIKNKPTGLKGKPRETILLTRKCFKLMTMQSRTKKAIEIREYYYELEQVIVQYKEKTNLKIKWKGKQDGGNLYIALYRN